MLAVVRCVAFGVVMGLVGTQSASAQTADDLFNPDVLQRVELWMNSQDLEKLRQDFQLDTYYPADITVLGVTTRNVGVKSRGGGSRSGRKVHFRVDANHYTSGQTMFGLKSFNLDNLWQDPSGVRETVAMRLYARLGIPAPREAHARLYINGEYSGLYAIVESVNKDLLARIFGEIDGDVQNDGYLYDYEWLDAWYFNYLGSSLDPYKSKFDAVTHENKSDVEKWGPIEELVRMVNDTPIDRFNTEVGERVDLRAFIRYMALQNFASQDDGFLGYAGVNNFYFYRLENSPRHVFIAWDEDIAFGPTDFGLTTRHSDNVLMRRTMELPEYRMLYFDTLLEAAQSAGEGEWLQGEIRRQLDLVTDAMRDDPLRPYTFEEHEAHRASMLAFPSARITYVRCEVAKQTGQPLPAGCS